jgi:protein TonB
MMRWQTIRRMKRLAYASLAAAAVALAGCATPPPPAPPTPTLGSTGVVPPSSPFANAPAPQPAAPRGQTLAQWKRDAAQKIHAHNKQHIAEGKLPQIVHAVVVVQLTVAPDGRVVKSEVLRRPDYAAPEAALAIKTAHAASPLPPVPASAGKGNIQVAETWLFRKDGRFQLRTLASAE